MQVILDLPASAGVGTIVRAWSLSKRRYNLLLSVELRWTSALCWQRLTLQPALVPGKVFYM